jgi:hypothetical protein
VRKALRATLMAASLLSVVICGVALRKQGLVDPAAWATVAAALAVLAAVTSAWTGQRVLEMQEDALEPNLLPAIDVRSRTSLAQFKVTNHGGSHAYDVAIAWDRQIPARDGASVTLGATPIPMIPKGESASVLINTSHEFIHKTADTTFTGRISFKNARGRRFSEPFTVTAEHERAAMVLVTDAQELQEDVEKIRAALQDIAKSLRQHKHEGERV